MRGSGGAGDSTRIAAQRSTVNLEGSNHRNFQPHASSPPSRGLECFKREVVRRREGLDLNVCNVFLVWLLVKRDEWIFIVFPGVFKGVMTFSLFCFPVSFFIDDWKGERKPVSKFEITVKVFAFFLLVLSSCFSVQLQSLYLIHYCGCFSLHLPDEPFSCALLTTVFRFSPRGASSGCQHNSLFRSLDKRLCYFLSLADRRRQPGRVCLKIFFFDVPLLPGLFVAATRRVLLTTAFEDCCRGAFKDKLGQRLLSVSDTIFHIINLKRKKRQFK